ncbi:MAG: histidine phosphatase family protein [Opitutaceae bacterium]|nr:histidine phosphatase family protein [Opitutaceae bacterium]
MRYPRFLRFHRYRRLMLLLGLVVLASVSLPAQTTYLVVRHADRGPEEPDAALTAEGHLRAAALAGLLGNTRITRIFTTEYQRTRDTAAPTARHHGVKPVVVPQAEFDALTRALLELPASGECCLVVGHRSTVPRIVRALSGLDIPPLGSSEFSCLIVVTRWPDGRASVLPLRVELPATPPAS